jgi:peroxiredoxin
VSEPPIDPGEPAGGPGAVRRPPPPRRGPRPDHRPPAPVINTRPYRVVLGLFAVVLLVGFTVYELTTRHARSPAAAVGHRLQYFAAPLAASTLNGDANLHPPCTAARHDPRALNVCLIAQRSPLVLAFFATGSKTCEREVSTLQAVAAQLPAGRVATAGIAVGSSHADTRAAVRAHHWRIPVAYDADGAVGAAYDVQVCPVVELVRRGGVIAGVLIGNHWLSKSALAGRVRTLLSG